MREIEDLTDDEREKLKRLMPKALDLIDAQYVNNGRLETELSFFVGKIERIDEFPDEWRERVDHTGDAERAAALTECSEELSDILGGSAGRIARLRKEGLLPPKDAETASDLSTMMEEAARDLARRNRPPKAADDPAKVPFVLRGAVPVTADEQRRPTRTRGRSTNRETNRP